MSKRRTGHGIRTERIDHNLVAQVRKVRSQLGVQEEMFVAEECAHGWHKYHLPHSSCPNCYERDDD